MNRPLALAAVALALTVPACKRESQPVDGKGSVRADSAWLSSHKPDFEDGEWRAWRLSALAGDAADKAGSVVEVGAADGTRSTLEAGPKAVPVLTFNRQGELVVMVLDPGSSRGRSRARMSGRSFTRAETRVAGFVTGLLALTAVAACNTPSADAPAEQQETVVAAAASLRHVLPVLVDRWGKGKVTVTYGASGDLRKQVEAGAPIDLVLFASTKPVTQLAEAQLTVGQPMRIATNTLVLVGPSDGKKYGFADLPTLPRHDKLAIGDPGAVPAGDYAKQALTALGHWEAMQDRIVLGGDVAAVLAYAKRGEVAAAIVYRTEAHGISGITVFDEAPKHTGPKPEVVGSVVKSGRNVEGAKSLLAWLTGPDAQRILADAGFGAP